MTRKKFFYYNAIFYVLLLLIEVASIVLFQLSTFAENKVLSSIDSEFFNIFSAIWVFFCWYLVSLVIIYLSFSFFNFLISEFLAKTFFRIKNEISFSVYHGVFLVIVNAVFLFAVYLLNSSIYPSSYHSISEDGFFYVSFVTELEKYFTFLSVAYFSLLLLSSHCKSKFLGRFILLSLVLIVGYNYLPPLLNRDRVPLQRNVNDGPNVIVLGVDSLRPDLLSHNGNLDNITPNIDIFLEDAFVFNNAHTPLARTYPSWMSILSGAYPTTNGARYNLIKNDFLERRNELIPSILRNNHGYSTVYGMDETRFCNLSNKDGFDELIQPLTGIKDFLFVSFHDLPLVNIFFNNKFGYFLFPFIKYNRASSLLYDGKIFTESIINKIADLANKKKFFLGLHFCAAHWPYNLSNSGHYQDQSIYDSYLKAIHFADKQVGTVLEQLKAQGLYDKSIIILLSDHGESFQEETFGHGTSLYDNSQNHIVLAVKPVGHSGKKEIDRLVGTIDIAPTIFSLLNFEYDSGQLDGVSLFSENINDERMLFFETGFHLFHPVGTGFNIDEMIREGASYYEVSPQTGLITMKLDFHQPILDSKQLAVMTNRWKLVAQKDTSGSIQTKLFDLKHDYNLTLDVKTQYPDVSSFLLNEVRAHFGVTDKVNVALYGN